MPKLKTTLLANALAYCCRDENNGDQKVFMILAEGDRQEGPQRKGRLARKRNQSSPAVS